MTSKADATEAFVWIWLPGATEPVVAGRLFQEGERLLFNYGASYRGRKSAIPIYEPELPLQEGAIAPINGLQMASCIRDGSPDAWGRRVIINRLTGKKPDADGVPEISELTYLLHSGSDRTGALDFQASATEYVPRRAAQASLDELMEAAALVEKGVPLTPALAQALNHGTSIGGARPKALINDDTKKFIAKFSASNDTYSVVKAEFIAMRLASASGLDVASVSITRAAHKDVLLIERFDRRHTKEGWTRQAMVSALTILGLDEMMARYASYEDLAELIRHRFTAPKDTLKELYGRICFNVLCGNTDDHARNHAAFWDGKMMTLTPAYDICPQSRTGTEATQAMLIKGEGRASTLANCLAAAPDYHLKEADATALIEHQITTIAEQWQAVCAEAELTPVDRQFFAGRQFLNNYAIEGLEGHKALHDAFGAARKALIASGDA
ncbi:type II toxin-antitoxin system HipA family toxin [Sinorhizobium medicae]|uniref:type II toxin-antitoxin system HipA family toxin n=1 Tax=Sinorhizobium medicae TaxID=110321 RepID=UPI000C79F034|nr:HipA domain-containing protein [Sinorhizobium medicae]MDX0409237.1 type II toxin-antitoxin system HipA family toxin [Sinorhizobium medicae]MDX0446270.1 type II toxin-antitoxin system HipA family toxin [Sinorhizobium medicae]MDX0470337.1 type II toxin-antitoxin system HipA family toxin [Sinorhizobium medicae]MDX0655408.1 type II toxin-antitoxin system HipA family toxin [Sinorhizobium medicae]MDX0772930.1 type II toxin-antitoxin system HipA family toxin [Sinorhizobium medicae]